MTKTTKEILFWLSCLAAFVAGAHVFLLGYPGDAVSQDLLIGLGAADAGLAGLLAVALRRTS